MDTHIIPITDDRGRLLIPYGGDEPLPGSVVLTQGLHGTAWQRHFADGMWHSTRGGAARHWIHMKRERNLVLVYNAEPRLDQQAGA